MRSPQPTLSKLIADKSEPEAINPLSELMRRLYKPEDDCDEDDCEDLTCPDCGSTLETVFGSLPLEVQCTACSKMFVLRTLLSASP